MKRNNSTIRVASLILLLQFTFSTARTQSLPEQVSITSSTFESYFGVYFLDKQQITSEDIIKLAKKRLPGFRQLNDFPEDITEDAFILEYYDNVEEDFTPFDMESLQYFGIGLSEAEKLSLQQSPGAFSLSFIGTSHAVIEKQRNISQLLSDIVQKGSFVLTDYNTYQAYNRDSWKASRLDNFKEDDKNVVDQITIHTYREYEFCRAVTLGMNKFSLPDISIKAFSCSDQRTFGSLINAIVQHMAERGTINADSTFLINLDSIKNHTIRDRFLSDLEENAEKKITVKLEQASPEEGDNPNAQFRIDFNDPKYSTPQEVQQEKVAKLFGSYDEIDFISHDEALLQASAAAKIKLLEYKPLFEEGLQAGFALMVKGPFPTDSGGREWMWVEITNWEDNVIYGTLQNDPYDIAGLKAGARVNVKQEDVFDYIYYKPDGTYEGNKTGELIMKNKDQ